MIVSLRKILLSKEGSIILVTIVLQIFAALFVDRYTGPANLKLLLRAIPTLGILAIGVTILMISGEFDLSIGSTFALAPMIGALVLGAGLNIWICILVALFIGGLVGFSNGIMTVKTGMPSFIVTIGAMMFWRGIVLVIADGRMVPFELEGVSKFVFNDAIGLVSTQFIWFVLVTFVLTLFLAKTQFGNWIFATGGNLKAARAMGINSNKVKIVCFIVAGVLAALAGIFDSVRVDIVNPQQGGNIALTAIAAMVIGGTRLEGGVGTVLGTFFGAVIMFTIQDILMLMRVSAYLFQSFVGIVIILAMIGNQVAAKGAKKL
jgi:simple sugar transport system permease protein